jgi:hypothetical protein
MSRVGAERTSATPIWPTKLVRPATRLIYLDLDQWIALARANTGHPDGLQTQAAFARLRARLDGWTYVIGMPLIMEITGIRRRGQLAALADVIEELTDFACIMPLTTIAPLEFESALAAFAPIEERFESIPLLGRGVLQACGMRGGLKVRDRAGNDVTARARMEARVGPEEFDRRMAEGERLLDRSVLRGPAGDEEERQLRSVGWDP